MKGEKRPPRSPASTNQAKFNYVFKGRQITVLAVDPKNRIGVDTGSPQKSRPGLPKCVGHYNSPPFSVVRLRTQDQHPPDLDAQ
jgi:hypothetical protein